MKRPDVERIDELHRRVFRDHALDVLDAVLVVLLIIVAIAALR